MATPPSATLEERFGTQWVVWIGGLALALGAIFLVRYTVEQGLLGPGVRIFLAAVFAAILIAAGEWTRRKEIAVGVAVVPTRHIPSILTAAGTIAVYATVYGAYALYGFIGPGAAFILLGIVAEQYTYSTVWLGFGVALLMAGFFLRSQPARLASAAVVAITIGKVFLVDLAGLTGIFCALSFIGLGAVLVGIGWLYQRLLFPSRGGAITKPANEPR